MDAIGRVKALVREGRFAEALGALESAPSLRLRTPEVEALWVQVLERTGRYGEAEECAVRLLRTKSGHPSHRSVCEFTLGLVRWDRGLTPEALAHFQRAGSWAREAGDLANVCWAELRLLVAIGGQSQASVAARRLAEVRQEVVRLGDPVVSAALHILLGEMEAKRGLVAVSMRHTRLGQSLLRHGPNVWLDAVAENNLAAASIMLSDVEAGMFHAERALDLATESGAAAMRRAALANLGNLHHMRGNSEQARDLLRQSVGLLPSSGEYSNGGLDSLARTYLAEGQPEEALRYFQMIEKTVRAESDWSLYANRYALLTKAEILMAMKESTEACTTADRVIDLARKVSDRVLEAAALSRRAQIARSGGGGPSAADFVSNLSRIVLETKLPEAMAQYERALGTSLVDEGHADVGAAHLDRSSRAFRTLGCASALREVDRAQGREYIASPNLSSPAVFLQDTAAVLMHAGRPELVATGLIAVLKQLRCVTAAQAVSLGTAQDDVEVLDSFGVIDTSPTSRTLLIGTARGRTVELRVGFLADLESQATVNSVSFIVSAVQDLERGRIEREERLTLWPVDELPAVDDDSVVTGRMRELMIFARKVAQTNVAVLVTGESGTGKEVLARAIHRYSPRAKKPFIPFNCTAVPRELLESQLFGYRRGAFTGAERDNPGLIRAAKDGTLFLDEIGELGLDLQPKLLRFLESGEINPLGETSPFNVNVRIVAATNANLRQLVAEGRFREDLYYRLNVIELELPPLRDRRDEIPALAHQLAAKAGQEFGKGRITVGEEIMAHLLVYPWPGNIRQLNNELRRMVAIVDQDSALTPDHLPRSLRTETDELLRRANGLEIAVALTEGLDQTVARIEREMIKVALKTHHGKVEAAAKALGISRKGLYLKRRRLGL